MKKLSGDKNGMEEGSDVVSSSRSEGRSVGEEEEEEEVAADARMASKKKRAEKRAGAVKEGEVLSLKKAKQPSGDANVSHPQVVLCLSKIPMTSRRTRKREKTEGDRDKVPTSSVEEGGGVKNPKQGDGDRGSGLKNRQVNGEKADTKDTRSCRLPLNRVRTMVRSDDPNIRVTNESYFLICKATEYFIEQLCDDAFSLAASHGLKKLLKYDHLASLVYNMDRYDFLSDYVPLKIKAKDALPNTKAPEEARQA
ncbi:hypothetical protein MLD38_003524 [Melastoma candidum]|uniref:Uncharacterized protein n=1 Tax=Melastoma candidum TaxID=119954 RepID=A0ACB9S611_9MYRT|nr:hypothetical protein MLD38_003524 [Melastoma candidum]